VQSSDPHVTAFHDLLEERSVSPDFQWNDVVKSCVDDRRWAALPSVKQKKAAFGEWAAATRRVQEEERQRKSRGAREALQALLRECMASGKLRPHMRYSEAEKYLAGDARFDGMSREQRAHCFEDFMYEEERLARERKRELAKANMEALREEFERDSSVNVESQWRQVGQRYQERSELFRAMPREDALRVFEEVIRRKEDREAERRALSKEEEKRKARKARAAFRELLEDKYRCDEFDFTVRFKDFLPKMEKDRAYTDLLGLPGSTPRDLYYDYVNDLEDAFRKRRKRFESYMVDFSFPFEVNTTVHEFEAELDRIVDKEFHKEFADFIRTFKNFERRELYEQLKIKAEYREKERARKQQRREAALVDLLTDPALGVSTSDDWDSAKEKLKSHRAYDHWEDEQAKQAVFEAFKAGKLPATPSSTSSASSAGAKRKREEGEASSEEDQAKKRSRK